MSPEMDIAQQISTGLSQYVNWILVLMVGALVEVVKIFLPDNIENRVLPAVSIVIGILIAVFMLKLGANGIPCGVTSGIIASGSYAFILKVIREIFGGEKNG